MYDGIFRTMPFDYNPKYKWFSTLLEKFYLATTRVFKSKTLSNQISDIKHPPHSIF